MWQTYTISDNPSWARCLWCGGRGHFREACAREHAHGAVVRGDMCLGCHESVTP